MKALTPLQATINRVLQYVIASLFLLATFGPSVPMLKPFIPSGDYTILTQLFTSISGLTLWFSQQPWASQWLPTKTAQHQLADAHARCQAEGVPIPSPLAASVPPPSPE
jgi:hypothetical protein